MSSSIEPTFDPPEWATNDEVIKSARHYVNYWRAEAISANNRLRQVEDEAYTLRNKVEWLRLAEHLVIWDGERWNVRQEMLPK